MKNTKCLLFLILLCGVFGIAKNSLAAGDIYVSTTGNDTTGTGAIGSPVRTIAHALTHITDSNGGWNIILRGVPGGTAATYYEHDIYIAPSKTGTSGAWNSISSYPTEWAIIDGQRQCVEGTQSVIRNGESAEYGDSFGAKYWKFERLEITGGGLEGSSGASAAGIWWNNGPVAVRYCYIHDNLADNQDENPAGFNGASQQFALIEYNYFRNNGSIVHGGDNDRNICMFCSSEYNHSNPYDERWYVRNNIIRYNLVDANGGGGIKTKASQRLTSVRDDTDYSHQAWGDKIYNNIVINAKLPSIFWIADYVQIYNNIIAPAANQGWSYGIAIRPAQEFGSGHDMMSPVIYNNTIINDENAAIFTDIAGVDSQNPHYYVYNNLIDNHQIDTKNNDKCGIVFADSGTPNPISSAGIKIDRNYFYRSAADYIMYLGSKKTLEQWKAISPNAINYKNDYNVNNPLFLGSDGANRYKVNANHTIETGVSIADGGIGKNNPNHPYLSGVTIPSYIGAVDPNNGAWVDAVMSLSDINYLKSGGQPSGDTTPPNAPSGLSVS